MTTTKTQEPSQEPTKSTELTDAELDDVKGAETVRSQAEKRLETQRKDLVRNWGG